MTAKPTLKLFYALWPDEATRKALAGLQAAVQGKKTRPENLHLTLAFLGEQLPSVLPVLEDVLQDLPPCDIALTIDRYGYFKRSRVVWAGMTEVPKALIRLQNELAHRLATRHVSFDDQPVFTPHVTLARNVERSVAAPVVASATASRDTSLTPIVWHAQTIALVESVSQPEGVCYRVLRSR